jgi:hypothetical protein
MKRTDGTVNTVKINTETMNNESSQPFASVDAGHADMDNGKAKSNTTMTKDEHDDAIAGSHDDTDTETTNTSIVSSKKWRKRKVYNGMIECNVDPIRSLILCTLCDGLYREPYTTLKCFHTFCKSCLVTAIRSSYNTPNYNCCPICSTYFGRDDLLTNIALPDRILETLIDKVLFQHLAYQDSMLESEFYSRRGIERKDTITGTQPGIPSNVRSTTGSTIDSVALSPPNHQQQLQETPMSEVKHYQETPTSVATMATATTTTTTTTGQPLTTPTWLHVEQETITCRLIPKFHRQNSNHMNK